MHPPASGERSIPVWESVRAKLRLMVKTILKKYKYPPDGQLQQADGVGALV